MAMKSYDNRNAMIIQQLRFQNVFCPHAKPAFFNSSDFKSVFEKLRFRVGLVSGR